MPEFNITGVVTIKVSTVISAPSLKDALEIASRDQTWYTSPRIQSPIFLIEGEPKMD